ncbi:MAG: hypothetical protein ABH884_02525, partial [Candidatus Komeilibacteria bacterium]
NKTKDYYFCSNRDNCNESYIPTNVLEKQAENLFKKIELSEDFIKLVMNKVKESYNKMKEISINDRQALINQKTIIEQKRDKAEEKLLDGLISDQDFTRLRNKFKNELDDIDTRLFEIEAQKDLKIDHIQEILNFTRNIHQAYTKAPFELKRRYLGLFFDKLVVSNKKIKKPIINPVFGKLINEQKLFYKIQKPLQSEMVYVTSTGSKFNELVKVRNEWGG